MKFISSKLIHYSETMTFLRPRHTFIDLQICSLEYSYTVTISNKFGHNVLIPGMNSRNVVKDHSIPIFTRYQELFYGSATD